MENTRQIIWSDSWCEKASLGSLSNTLSSLAYVNEKNRMKKQTNKQTKG